MNPAYPTTRLDSRSDREDLWSRVVDWILAAGHPYFEWFFGSPESARDVISGWMQRDTSEVSARRVVLVAHDDHEIVGGFIGLSADELKAARMADALALSIRGDPLARKGLIAKLRVSSDLFRIPERDEYYLSKMGVSPSLRGRGHGRGVLSAFISAGTELGFEKFSLDVATDNTAARRIYESAGFRVVSESSVPGSFVAYTAMVLDLRGGR